MPKRKKLSQKEKTRRQREREAKLRAEVKRLKAKNKRLASTVKNAAITIAKLRKKPRLTPEEAFRAIKEIAVNLAYEPETDEARRKRMVKMWREVDAMLPRKGETRREMLLNWVQRNEFDTMEFWEEYRRRKK